MAAERRPEVLAVRAHAVESRRAGRLDRHSFRVHRLSPSTEVPGAAFTRPADGAGTGATAERRGDPVAALGAVVTSLDALAGTVWHEVSGQGAHDALDLLEQVSRRLAAVRSEVLSVVEGNGLWATSGSRTFPAWLRARTGATAGSASRQVRESRALRDHLPLTRAALAAGRVGADHVGVLVREATRTARLREQLGDVEVGEGFLVEQAAVMDAGTFTRLVGAWAVAADPQGADRAWREAGAKEQLTIAPTTGGYHLSGWLDEVSGQLVSTALRAHAGRKGADDDRTPAQRRAAALVALAHQSLDAGLQGASARVRPHLTVTMSFELLRALAAATGSAVPPVRADGQPYEAGAAFGPGAAAALTATGGPREQASDDPEARSGRAGAGSVEVSGESLRWVEGWEPGDEHVISTAIDHEALVGLEPAVLEDGTPIAPALLARLACESQLARVVFGPLSTILDAGREQRIFPAGQVRAVIARDKHCQYPGCDEPPGFGEIHHSLWWAQHLGGTDAEHGVLLCWHHHDWVHAQEISITRAAGQWWFRDRHGWLITAQGTHRP